MVFIFYNSFFTSDFVRWVVCRLFSFFLVANYKLLCIIFQANKQLKLKMYFQVFQGHSCVTLQQINCLVQSW